MLVIIGKTASGKTTVVNKLCKKGYKQIITYTTRPRRKGEAKDAYHFISGEDFAQKLREGFFAEYNLYQAANGELWYYGSALEDYENADEKTVVILTPSGLREVKHNCGDNVQITSIYLYANIGTIQDRLKKRGDNKDEAARRVAADGKDFHGCEVTADRIVYNNNDDDVNNAVKKIIEFYEGGDSIK